MLAPLPPCSARMSPLARWATAVASTSRCYPPQHTVASSSALRYHQRGFATGRTHLQATVDGGVSSFTSNQNPSAAPAPQTSGKVSKDTLQIERVKPSYVLDHHIYKPADLDNIGILHHKPQGVSDRVAAFLVYTMRTIFDIATRYPAHHQFPVIESRKGDVVKMSSQASKAVGAQAQSHGEEPATTVPEAMPLDEMRKKGLTFGPDQWMTRFIFLESVAGVPGMVAGTARHLHSLRLLRRDRGWISTCLEDAENERMHLLTFLAIRQPGALMRFLLLGTQGIFYNFLFLFYLMAPKTVHRFVGILEEEAVYTYTRVVEDIEAGRLPEWENYPAPQIAKDYWKLDDGAKMLDLIKVIRADEAGHRFIHHTFANLDQATDTNPFSIATPTPSMIGSKLHLTREESLAFIEKAAAEAKASAKEAGPDCKSDRGSRAN